MNSPEGEPYLFSGVDSVFRYVLCGFFANYLEWNHFKNFPSSALMPTRSLFFGIIIVQPKGICLSGCDATWIRIERALKERAFSDRESLSAENFCVWKGQVRMLDYGNIFTVRFLESKNASLLEKALLI